MKPYNLLITNNRKLIILLKAEEWKVLIKEVPIDNLMLITQELKVRIIILIIMWDSIHLKVQLKVAWWLKPKKFIKGYNNNSRTHLHLTIILPVYIREKNKAH